MTEQNFDDAEINKFDALAKKWWDPNGPMRALHQLNPLRLNYIKQKVKLKNQRCLDVGCGAGLLSEALATQNAEVTAIDLSPAAIEVATEHAKQQSLTIDYKNVALESLIQSHHEYFDVITCMELLEHVPDPQQMIKDCAQVLKPGGIIFFATINRSIKSYLTAIIGAEYILGMLPKGTHEYAKFIRPAELHQWANNAKLDFQHLQGLSYRPLSKTFNLSQDVSTNYMVCYQK